MTECQVCRAKTDGFICRSCVDEIHGVLLDLPRDFADLAAVMARQARGPLGLGDPEREWHEEDTRADDAGRELPARLRTLSGRVTLPTTPWPFAPHAADLRWAIEATVVTWWRHIAESRIGEPPAGPTCLTCVHSSCVMTRRDNARLMLIVNIDAIAYDEAAAQIHAELTSIPDVIDRAVIGRREASEFVGRCDLADVRVPAPVDGTLRPELATCGADLYARPDDKFVECDHCGAAYDVIERRAKIRDKLADEWARPHVIASGLTQLDQPVKVDTLYKWIERGHLKQVGKDDDGHALYRVGDVQIRVDAAREREEARRALREPA